MYVVVECDDNDSALGIVKTLLDRGATRLMLLDDLSKHPSLKQNETTTLEKKNIPLMDKKEEPATPVRLQSEMNMSQMLGLNSGEEEEMNLNEQMQQSERESRETQAVVDMIRSTTPQRVDIRSVKTEAERNYIETIVLDDNENEEMFSDYDQESSFDLLARVQCLNSSAGPSEPKRRKLKACGELGPDYHTCQLCHTSMKAPRGGRWNLQMHVMAMHSVQRPFQCPSCDYTDYRKPGIRKHTILSHGKELDPIDITTDEKRKEWDVVMGECFPEFAARTGFLHNARFGNPIVEE